jgi:hypothetical protein
VKEDEMDIYSRKPNKLDDAFESWAHSLSERNLEPDTLGELIELLGSGNLAQVGVDATSTIEALQGIGIEDDELQKDLEAIAKNSDGQANPQHTILAWLQKSDPEAAAAIEQASQQQTQPELEPQPDAQQMAQAPVQQQQAPITPQGQQPMAEEEQDEDEMHGKEPKSKGKTVRELAHWLGAFYNKDFKDEGFKSPWRKGPTELGIMAEKEFGPHHAHLVKELMGMKGGETKLQRAARRSHERKKEMEGSESVFNNHNEPKRASATRPGQQPPGLRMAEAGEFDVILRLAGLSK